MIKQLRFAKIVLLSKIEETPLDSQSFGEYEP